MGRCYFAKDAPAVEQRGGLVFIRPIDAPCEIAVTPHIMRKFIQRAEAAIAACHDAEVVELPRSAEH